MSGNGNRIQVLFVASVAVGCVMSASPVQGQQVAATVQLSGNPPAVSLALDASDEILYVGADVGAYAGAIYGIYIPNASIVGSVQLPGEPQSIAYSPATGLLYAANINQTFNNNINVINTKANPVTTSTVQVGSNAAFIALNPVNGKVYTANTRSQSVSVIDPSHNNSVTTIAIQTQEPHVIAFDSESGEIYVVAFGSSVGSLTAINPTTNSVDATVQVGQVPTAVVADPSTHNVYVSNYVDGTVDVISPSQGYAITHTISTGPYTGPNALALDANGLVYAASTYTRVNNSPGQVDVINPGTGYSVTAITVGINPEYIAFDSGAKLIAVANQGSNTVSYISPASLSVTTTVAVGTMPNAMITNGTYKGTAVANGGGTVSVITD